MLSPEEFEKRKKTNLKILKFGCLPTIVIIGLFIYILIKAGVITNDETKAYVKEEMSVNTIISHIKKDTTYIIKEVFYKETDSTLNIVIANDGSVEKNELYANDYFTLKYEVYDLKEIQQIAIYDFKKGASIADYKNVITSDTRKLHQKRAEFYKKNGSGDFGFIPVETYLKYNLDDPSVKFARPSTIEGMNANNTFRTRSVYRAKNKYGGLVLYTIYCDVDMNSNVSNVVITEGVN